MFKEDLIRFPENIEGEDYLTCTYYLETPLDLYKAGDAFAAEQSTGTWMRVKYETDERRRRHGAKVVGVYQLPEKGEKPSLPTSIEIKSPLNRGIIQIAFPHINFGPRLPNMLSTIAGNLYEMGVFTAVKLLDVHFPKGFVKEFQGPRFGIGGTRKILKVHDRPIVGAIIKPCVGLSPKEIAELAYQGFRGGLDFIKDDELFADTAYNKVEERVPLIMEAADRAREETGERKMYAFNITDEVDKILELHDLVVEGGGNCVMLNFVTAGFSALRILAEHTKAPIHAHRDFFPPLTRSPYIGMTAHLFTKLSRLAGADQLHIGAIQGKLYETDDEVLLNIRTCVQELYDIEKSLPVCSGGQWAGKAPVNYRKIGHVDFLHLSGAGTFAHPDGAESGARSIRQAWDATLKGIKLEEYAEEHKELRKAIEHFGRPIY